MTNELLDEEEAELNLWVQHQIEQEAIDRNDLQMFEEMRQQEQQERANLKKARKQYSRLVKKYVDSLT